MFDRRLLTHFNWPLLIVAFLLAGMGLLNLRSATSSFDVHSIGALFRAQLMWSGIGFGLMIVIVSIHYRHLSHASYFFYGMSLLLLILVLVVGRKIAGHQSWLQFGGISLQPSELAKLGLIFGLAKYFSDQPSSRVAGFLDLIPSFILFLLPALLVLKQGDLGSSLFFGLIYLTLALLQGIRWKVIASLASGGIILCVVAYSFLSPYQKDRITTFMNPEMDRKGAGYHVIQSRIAVGSGGWVGKGYLKGQTHKLKFVPERHTDFIFSVLAEEWGFLGCSFILLLYLAFLLLELNIAFHSHERFCFFLCVGLASLVFWHMVINLGGVLGLMPLTGVPLPFFSYGGSALLANWIALALALNISMRRFMF